MGPCMCGDTECPSCGPLLGNPLAGPADPGDLPTHCEACGKLMIEDEGGTIYLCSGCVLKIHGIVFPKGGTNETL